MANRHTLHISKLEYFKKWIVKDGWKKGWKTDELFKGYSRTETDLGE